MGRHAVASSPLRSPAVLVGMPLATVLATVGGNAVLGGVVPAAQEAPVAAPVAHAPSPGVPPSPSPSPSPVGAVPVPPSGALLADGVEGVRAGTTPGAARAIQAVWTPVGEVAGPATAASAGEVTRTVDVSAVAPGGPGRPAVDADRVDTDRVDTDRVDTDRVDTSDPAPTESAARSAPAALEPVTVTEPVTEPVTAPAASTAPTAPAPSAPSAGPEENSTVGADEDHPSENGGGLLALSGPSRSLSVLSFG